MTRPFRFGAQVNNARSRERLLKKAKKLEDAGYSTMFMADHFDDQLAPIPALAAAATATNLRIGNLVLDNDYRHPVVTAKEAATLDLLSDGRLEFGLGAGWMKTDYDQSGIAYDPPGVRIDRFLEGLEIIKGLWTGEPFSFSGKHYTITELAGTPAPVQKPHPPIVIGAGAKRMLRIAGREADIVSVNFDLRSGAVDADMAVSGLPEATAQKIEWIKDGAGDRFADIELSVTVFMSAIVDNREEFAGMVAQGFGLTAEQGLSIPHFLVGTESQIIEDLQRRREEYGFSYVVISGGAEETMAPIVSKLAGT